MICFNYKYQIKKVSKIGYLIHYIKQVEQLQESDSSRKAFPLAYLELLNIPRHIECNIYPFRLPFVADKESDLPMFLRVLHN